MLLCELLCVLSAFLCVLFYEFYMSKGYTHKKKHVKEKYEYCFQVSKFIPSVDICAHRYTFLYLHALCLLAAVYVGSVAFSVA